MHDVHTFTFLGYQVLYDSCFSMGIRMGVIGNGDDGKMATRFWNRNGYASDSMGTGGNGNK